jgi:apolipoprotein N-acyltransferase
VVGATTYAFRPEGLKRYNSALVFEPGVPRVTGRYDKLHLVPFGEYVPLLETFPWLTRLTPYQGDFIPSMVPGQGAGWFTVRGRTYATAICFEDGLPHVVRRLMKGDRAGAPAGAQGTRGENAQPDVLLNLSNDGWFRGSSELDMHLAVSIFRAVENRVPVARAVNTGISAVIDGNGRVIAALPKMKAAALVASVPLDARQGLYTWVGDWLPMGCLGVAVGAVGLRLAGRRFGSGRLGGGKEAPAAFAPGDAVG